MNKLQSSAPSTDAQRIINACYSSGVVEYAQNLKAAIRKLCEEKAAIQVALDDVQVSRKLWIDCRTEQFMAQLLSEIPRTMVREDVIAPFLEAEAAANQRQREAQFEFMRARK